MTDHPLFPILALGGLWCLVSLVLAELGGWRELASSYQTDRPFSGRTRSGQSAEMRRGAGYNRIVTVGADPSGLYLSMFLPFRLGHPPLLIPWSEVTTAPVRRWFVDRVELRFARASGVFVRISDRLAQRLAQEAGPAWPAVNAPVTSMA